MSRDVQYPRHGLKRRIQFVKRAWTRLNRVDEWEVHACYGYEDNDRNKKPTKTYRLMVERQPLINWLHHQLYDFFVCWVFMPNSYKADIKCYYLGQKNKVTIQDIDLEEDSRLWDSYWLGEIE